MVISYEILLCVRLSGSCCLLMACQPCDSMNGYITTYYSEDNFPISFASQFLHLGKPGIKHDAKSNWSYSQGRQTTVQSLLSVPPRKPAAAQPDLCPLRKCCCSSLPGSLSWLFCRNKPQAIGFQTILNLEVSLRDQVLAVNYHPVRGCWYRFRWCWVGLLAQPADRNWNDWEMRLWRSSSSSVIAPITVANSLHAFWVFMLQRMSMFVLQLYCLAWQWLRVFLGQSGMRTGYMSYDWVRKKKAACYCAPSTRYGATTQLQEGRV